ncbi:energy-coupling factor transporter ATPase [Ureibacillus sp. FSL K6-0786]|uniref:ABC transporter ATP-binding protein n=1 Tax=Ureibacillus sp. FSL K6-0786 TaxID=2954607 RepID=UPI0030D91E5E
MVHYQIQNVSFAYPDISKNVLERIHLEIEEGEFVLLCGPSGSGKSTLLKLLKKEVQPEGEKEGIVYYRNIPLDEVDSVTSVEEIAMVFQDPDNQIVMNTVWQELTFGMENLGYTTEQIQRRLGEIVNFFGIEEWLHLSVHELSGGQKQIVNLAAVMTLRPRVLLLDEPTAQLDPIAAKEFLQLLLRINEELFVTVIISEHRLEELFPIATKVVMLNEGKIAYSGSSQEVLKEIWRKHDNTFIHYIPTIPKLYLSLMGRDEEDIPITVKEGKQWLNRFGKLQSMEFRKVNKFESIKRSEQTILECKDIFFQYDQQTPLILKGLNLTIQKGEFFALFGGNGSGKSTLLKNIVGILKQQKGKIYYKGQLLKKESAKERSEYIGYVAQNPAIYFTKETVREQLQERFERVKEVSSYQLDEYIQLFELESILDKHPFDISGGQQQKVVIVLSLMTKPEVLVLDEPTKGLDPLSKIHLAHTLNRLREVGKTILMVSHDIEFAAQYATRCGLLFNGEVLSVEDTKSFLKDNYFYTTNIHRTVNHILPNAISLEDVLNQWENLNVQSM